MFPLCFPRADDPPPPRKRVSAARRRCIIVSLSRGGVFGVRWRVSPGGGVGSRDRCRSEKKRIGLVRKTSFCFFLQKKKNSTKKKGKRDILRPKRRVFSTPNTKARRTTNQKTTTGQKRERTTTFQTRIIERAADSFENPSRVVVSRLFFL